MSAENYNPSEIEPKWREYWISHRLHEAKDDDPRPKYYCLDMFPYPSGSGLHVGHWRSYVLPDCWSRYKWLQGHKVLHPMGWDAFGSPAENDAIQKGIHPTVSTKRNIENFKRQLHEIGDVRLEARSQYDGPRLLQMDAVDLRKDVQSGPCIQDVYACELVPQLQDRHRQRRCSQ